MDNKAIFFLLIVFVGLTSESSEEDEQPRKFVIVEHSEDVTVKAGEMFYLFCKVDDEGDILINDEWKVCQWRRESDGHFCEYTYVCEGQYCEYGLGVWHVEEECEAELGDLHFDGDNPNKLNQKCGIYVPAAGPEDEGGWTCKLEECQSAGCGQKYGNGVFISATIQVTVD